MWQLYTMVRMLIQKMYLATKMMVNTSIRMANKHDTIITPYFCRALSVHKMKY